jgi:hypothetical protein
MVFPALVSEAVDSTKETGIVINLHEYVLHGILEYIYILTYIFYSPVFDSVTVYSFLGTLHPQ